MSGHSAHLLWTASIEEHLAMLDDEERTKGLAFHRKQDGNFIRNVGNMTWIFPMGGVTKMTKGQKGHSFFLTERNEIWDYGALATLGRHKLKFCLNKIFAHFCWVRKLVRMKRVYSSGLAGANYHFHVVFSPKLKAVSLRRWVRLLVNGPFIVGSTSSLTASRRRSLEIIAKWEQ